MSSDSETNTLTFSGLDDDSAGFDATTLNTASAPSIVSALTSADDLHRGRADGRTSSAEDHSPFPTAVDGSDAGRGKSPIGDTS